MKSLLSIVTQRRIYNKMSRVPGLSVYCKRELLKTIVLRISLSAYSIR